MCNVPEVIMCYHLDGIVQKYELIKTEDLPHMCENQFSPTLVRDVAQNILAFLNSKATKEGHTYWLFKGGTFILLHWCFLLFLRLGCYLHYKHSLHYLCMLVKRVRN